MKKLEAIKQFLKEKNVILSNLFTEEMEVQVNSAQDNGVKIQRSFNLGGRDIKWTGFKDDKEIWKSFRIPYNSNTSPIYVDKSLTFNTNHFEAIGLTGWNWVKKQSHWVGFDFDSIANHTQGLNDEDLQGIKRNIETVEWITIRRSTSGKGLHFYVFLDPPIITNNHTEHAALSRAILGIISARIGQQLEAKVDVCGGILWIWNRRQGIEGFSLIKQGIPLGDIPNNWKEHIEVISGKRKKTRSPTIEDEKLLEDLEIKIKRNELDDKHRQIIGWLIQNNRLAWWDSDHHLLVAHTYDLQECHRDLKLKGLFYTIATGKDRGHDQNCFGFPMRDGGWIIRRHTRKTNEHPSWTRDNSGWTKCYFNIASDFGTAARCHGGMERSDGNFEFSSANYANNALIDLGAPFFEIPEFIKKRPALLKQHRDGRVILSIMKQSGDNAPQNFTLGKDYWERLVNIQGELPETEVPDEFIRHTVQGNISRGWCIKTKGTWIYEQDNNVRRAMIASGYAFKNIEEVRGQCVLHPWTIVSKPFQPEYPGNRQWNQKAAQYTYDIIPLDIDTLILNESNKWYEYLKEKCPTWIKIFEHCGQGLNDAVLRSPYCKEYKITLGAQYLILWVVSIFTCPTEPLPYLFFFGPQNCGKSIFHEALSLLFKDHIGYIRADVALTNINRFNKELMNGVLCVIEEVNLGDSYSKGGKEAYNRIKDWVTARTILIHEKGYTPFEVVNTTHWIQCSNDPDGCPIFQGDTRIVVAPVQELTIDQHIKKQILLQKLEVETQLFLSIIVKINIPMSEDRLKVPVIISAEKIESAQINEIPIFGFLREKIYYIPGASILLQDLYVEFCNWLPIERRKFWQYTRFIRHLPDHIVIDDKKFLLLRGKFKGTAYHLANTSLNSNTKSGIPLIKIYDRLVEDI